MFWGGREGYQSLLNTDVKRELDHMGQFFKMAADYKKKIGFTGQLLIEPKPKEPMKHQYDYGMWECIVSENTCDHTVTVYSYDSLPVFKDLPNLSNNCTQ